MSVRQFIGERIDARLDIDHEVTEVVGRHAFGFAPRKEEIVVHRTVPPEIGDDGPKPTLLGKANADMEFVADLHH
ncbi:hypothetical protein D3C71_2102010 [compost metagenome]